MDQNLLQRNGNSKSNKLIQHGMPDRTQPNSGQSGGSKGGRSHTAAAVLYSYDSATHVALRQESIWSEGSPFHQGDPSGSLPQTVHIDSIQAIQGLERMRDDMRDRIDSFIWKRIVISERSTPGPWTPIIPAEVAPTCMSMKFARDHVCIPKCRPQIPDSRFPSPRQTFHS